MFSPPASDPDGDIFLPATLSKVSAAQTAPVLQAYFTNGFLINATRVLGSIALLPRAFFSWKVRRGGGGKGEGGREWLLGFVCTSQLKE